MMTSLPQITAPMARFVNNLARNAARYYEAADRLQRLCDAVGIDGIDAALQYGHVNELADFVALYGRLPSSFGEMVAYRLGVELRA